MDNYFEIYNNIISNFDIRKRNYSFIQNVNNMKKYNDNFIGNITEIIKDNNLKSQFTSIISLQTKIEFKNIILKFQKTLRKKQKIIKMKLRKIIIILAIILKIII